VLAEDDGMEPLMTAAAVARSGRQVTFVTPARTVASAVGRYNAGAPLADLQRAGAHIHTMRRIVAVDDGEVLTTGVYAADEASLGAFDTIIVAAGNESSGQRSLGARLTIGDAYTPWGLLAATRQGRQVVSALADIADV